MKSLFAFAAVMLVAGKSSCNKSGNAVPEPLRKLFTHYIDGSINECRLNGSRVYSASINAYDAATLLYDSSGNQIGVCNYAWGPVDSNCRNLQSCETIYRGQKHISGEPFVDKYGLSK